MTKYKTIAIANPKDGVGKTTMAFSLGIELAHNRINYVDLFAIL